MSSIRPGPIRSFVSLGMSLVTATIDHLLSYLIDELAAPPCTPITIIPDILFEVFRHSSQQDLARFLRVNHLFHEVAGHWLYGTKLGVEYGIDEYDYCGQVFPQSIFPPAADALPFGTPKWQTEGPPPNSPALLDDMSPFKRDLLGRVQHLTFHPCIHSLSFQTPTARNLFPSLQILTFGLAESGYLFERSAPFLIHLRPSHIRLTRIRDLGSPFFFRLTSQIGAQAQKVTLHFSTSLRDATRYCRWPLQRQTPCVAWPGSMRQLDLVFSVVGFNCSRVRSVIPGEIPAQGETSAAWTAIADDDCSDLSDDDTGQEQLFDSILNHNYNDREVDRCCLNTTVTNIAYLAASAFANETRIRVVGFGDAEEPPTATFALLQHLRMMNGDVMYQQLGADFPGDLREAYVCALIERGVEMQEARHRADDMEIISSDGYWREGGNVAF